MLITYFHFTISPFSFRSELTFLHLPADIISTDTLVGFLCTSKILYHFLKDGCIFTRTASIALIFCHTYIFGIIFKGKKPETILRKMQVAMEEARWRQPSIVVFDDVDYLIKQPDPVKDAEPTVQYHSKLAEGYSFVSMFIFIFLYPRNNSFGTNRMNACFKGSFFPLSVCLYFDTEPDF